MIENNALGNKTCNS